MGSEVYHHLKNVIKARYGLDATSVGDEGGFAPNIQENKEGNVHLCIVHAVLKISDYSTFFPSCLGAQIFAVHISKSVLLCLHQYYV